MASPTEPGWYPDPSGVAGQRYFDGTNWTDMYAEGALPRQQPTSGSAHSRQRAELVAAAVVAALVVLFVIIRTIR